jgi:NAD(P)-dependent dehydrogenase (short-subunit alcohol dehydrogenase family)
VKYSLEGQHVLVVGGSSGLGLATAVHAHELGAEVTIAARDRDRLVEAKAAVGQRCTTVEADVSDEKSMAHLFDQTGGLDHVFFSAGRYPRALIRDAEVEKVRIGLEDRFWGAFFVCKYGAPKLRKDGSITFVTGVAVFKPGGPGGSVVVAGAGAVDAFTRSMAKELAPIRINSLSPGLCDTSLVRGIYGDTWEQVSKMWSERVLVGRVGTAGDIAHAAMFLMTNTYVTGTTLHVEGGQRLV